MYVILPLLPAFEGEVGTGTGTLIQAITHWNYKSICRGSDSLKSRLQMHSQYISFIYQNSLLVKLKIYVGE